MEIKKQITLLLLFFVAVANAQIVSIPDANFKAKLLAATTANHIAYGNGGYMKIDENGDGEIQIAEAQAVDSLNVPDSEIANLTGIASFTNLKKLDCYFNLINTGMDISGLTGLTFLNCQNNQISELDVSALTNLTYLNCFVNALTSLNVAGLTNLEYLNCGNNEISVLDVGALINLTYLYCAYNPISVLEIDSLTNLTLLSTTLCPLTDLNLLPLVNLEDLEFGNTELNEVDLSSLTQLVNLDIWNYGHDSIDLSNLTLLVNFTILSSEILSLDLSNSPDLDINIGVAGCNSLEMLFLKNGGSIPFPSIANCPNLVFVCANENDIDSTKFQIENNTGNNPNVVVNSYCSFTPGGDYNVIGGRVAFDIADNGCDDDATLPFIKVHIDDTINQGAAFTDTEGIYNFYTQTGNFTITPQLENPSIFTVSPTMISLNLPTLNVAAVSQNFCIAANGIHPDIEVMIVPYGRAIPGFLCQYMAVIKNKGNQMLSGNLTVTYPGAVLDLTESLTTPDIAIDGTLGWNYTELLPFETRTFYFTMQLNSPLDSPPVNSGDVLPFVVSATPATDDVPQDNTFTFNQGVVNACDPNEKQCVEGDVVSPDQIGKYLHYVINFENIGTAPAQNIVVKDIFDETKFDVSSLQVLSSTHPVDMRLNANVAEFIFQGINLGIGGHGNILLKIKTKTSLQANDMVTNTADIYFDYNAAIATNEARTTFQLLSVDDHDAGYAISVFPNPTNGTVNIQSLSNIKSVEVYDALGRVLQVNHFNGSDASLDISGRHKGIYFLKITSDKGIKTEKIIKN